MDAFTRIALINLLGELLTGQKEVPEVERSLRIIMSDEKVKSYEIGLRDGREGLNRDLADVRNRRRRGPR